VWVEIERYDIKSRAVHWTLYVSYSAKHYINYSATTLCKLQCHNII